MSKHKIIVAYHMGALSRLPSLFSLAWLQGLRSHPHGRTDRTGHACRPGIGSQSGNYDGGSRVWYASKKVRFFGAI